MFADLNTECVSFVVQDVFAHKVLAHLIHSKHTNGAEVVIDSANVFHIGRDKFCIDYVCLQPVALDFQAIFRKAKVVIKESIERLFISFAFISDTGKVDSDNTDGTGGVASTKQTAVAVAKLGQIKTKTTAHRAYITDIEIAVYEVSEIRCAIFARHFPEKLVVGVVPIEAGMDVVCGDRISKELSFRVALKHNLKEDSVDEVNLSLAGAVCEAYKLAANDTVLVHHICGRSKVECKIEERGFCAGTAVAVYAEHEVLHRLLNFCIRKTVLLNERSKKGIEAVECNSTHNLVLENSD